jgi:hypothetical protein
MSIGVLDLSIVTNTLVDLLTTAVTDWQKRADKPEFAPVVTGNPPDLARQSGGAYLSMYLFELTTDKYQRNMPPLGRPVRGSNEQPIAMQPLSLDLYYLMNAFSPVSFVDEQRIMGMALKFFHDNPIIRYAPGNDGLKVEFSIGMEVESSDQLSRIWQSFAIATRLSVIYKASVIFMEPDQGVGPAPPVRAWTVGAANPAQLDAKAPAVFGTRARPPFVAPGNSIQVADFSPAAVVPAIDGQPPIGQRNQFFVLDGSGFQQPQSNRVYVSSSRAALPDGMAEIDVTEAWSVPYAVDHILMPSVVQPAAPKPPITEATPFRTVPHTVNHFVLRVPDAGGFAVGRYQLAVGNNLAMETPGAIRSAPSDLYIVPFIDPANGPMAANPSGPMTIAGAGFPQGLLDIAFAPATSDGLVVDGGKAVPITETSSAPGKGMFRVSATAIVLQLPKSIAAGRYAIRIFVNQPPALISQDLVDARTLVNTLKAQKDKVSEYLVGTPRFEQTTLDLLKSYDGRSELATDLLSALVAEFNKELSDRQLYNRDRFEGVSLRKETNFLVNNQHHVTLARMNRLLLEDAYAPMIDDSLKGRVATTPAWWVDVPNPA